MIKLTPADAETTATLTQRIAGDYPSADDPNLLRDLPILAAELPEHVRRSLRRFALDEAGGFCIISGHLIDQERIGPTPDHWMGRQRPGPEFAEEILLLLYAALLGEPFAWATQQDGHFVNDVFPVRQFENQLLGTGSKAKLTLHTEDVFHPYRADYILLSALRNPDRAPTTVAELDLAKLTGADIDILFQERFLVVPDTSHLPKNNSAGEKDSPYFESIERLLRHDRRIAVLFGSRQSPYLRFDETYVSPPQDDPEAVRAFTAVGDALRGDHRLCVLDAGDILVLNNHRVVHGRNPFTARYDGTDRWLKRVNVTTDLRKSSDMRGRLGPRLIG